MMQCRYGLVGVILLAIPALLSGQDNPIPEIVPNRAPKLSLTVDIKPIKVCKGYSVQWGIAGISPDGRVLASTGSYFV